MKIELKEWNDKGNLIHYKKDDYEYWQEWDSNGNIIHLKISTGVEEWHEYDDNGNISEYNAKF
jgi:hypothetical protein